jgi:hypothetical protein
LTYFPLCKLLFRRTPSLLTYFPHISAALSLLFSILPGLTD